MSKMRIAPRDRPKVKWECLRLLTTLKLKRAKMQMISGFVDTYLRLSSEEQRKFEKGLAAFAPQEKETAMQIMTSWKLEGIEEGLKQGREKGRQEGRQEGSRLEAERIALMLLRQKLKELPEAMEGRVLSLGVEKLELLTSALLDLNDLQEAEQWLRDNA